MSEQDVEMTWDQMNAMTAELTGESGPGSKQWKAAGSHSARFNRAVIDVFRKNNGKVPGEFGDVPLLIVNTTGAKSGKRRPVPLAYVEVDGRVLVMASMGGAHVNPPWFHNLVSHPDVSIEMNGETFDARAVQAKGAERDDLYRSVCEIQPLFRQYQERTERRIPVFELTRLS
jgi:deazaflavin-dependent oxidoreductase (nitroreductase family)